MKGGLQSPVTPARGDSWAFLDSEDTCTHLSKTHTETHTFPHNLTLKTEQQRGSAVKALAAFAEHKGLVLSTHMAAHDCNSSSRQSGALSCPP